MCTPQVDNVSTFGIHNTKMDGSFFLHQSLLTSCNQEGLDEFCLLPPSERLSPMCLAAREAFFQKVLNGQITKLTDLPKVWQIARGDVSASGVWLDVDASNHPTNSNPTNGNVSYPNTTVGYLGLQPLPLFQSVAGSGSNMIWGVADGRLLEYDSLTGMMSHLHPQVIGQADQWQRVALNETGDVGIVMFSDKWYLFQNGLFVQFSGFRSLDVQLFKSKQDNVTLHLVVVEVAPPPALFVRVSHFAFVNGTSNPAQAISTRDIPITATTTFAWSAVEVDNDVVFLATVDFNDASVMTVSNIDISSSLNPVTTQAFPNPLSPGTDPWLSVHRVVGGIANVFALHIPSNILYQFDLSANSVIVLSVNCAGLVRSLNGDVMVFTDLLGPIITTYGPGDIVGTFPSPQVGVRLRNVSLDASGNLLLLFYENKKIFYRNSQQSVQFFEQSSIYVNENAQVSDLGLLNFTVPSGITVKWFYGYSNVSKVHLGDALTSPHQFFRLLLASQTNKPLTTDLFATVATKLQRLNFAALVETYNLQLADNGALQALDSSKNVVWQNNISDAFNSPTETKQANSLLDGGITASLNGCYLLFADDQNVNIVFNVYNNGAFAEYCELLGERQDRALRHQTDFCNNVLFDEKTQTFADSRCTCLVNVDFVFPSEIVGGDTTRARLAYNLPCLLESCQGSLDPMENTNVAKAIVQTRCTGEPLTVCSTLILGSGKLKVQDGLISQKCGTNLLTCNEDIKCPIGSMCVGGKCAKICTTNADCISGQTCTSGVCLGMTQSQTTTSKNIGLIVVLVFVGVATLVFFSWLTVYLLKKKAQK